jgi:threonine dehydratase
MELENLENLANLTLANIQLAADRLAPYVYHTPLVSSRTISELVSAEVRLKAENLQRVGAFKIRGALNKIMSLPLTARAKGVVAFSSGNHAQGVALAAKILGCPATVIMPENSMILKVMATLGYGAKILQKGVNPQTRGEVAQRVVKETGATLVPPFDDPFIIAGQGTVGWEIMQDWSTVDTIVVPVGGGGLVSGIALAATSINPKVRVYGVEPAAGNDAQQSLLAGQIVTIDVPETLADGARTTAIGALPFSIMQQRLAGIVTVDDQALLRAIKLLALRAKLVVEPTGALAVAALLEGLIPDPGHVVAVLSGGNIAPEVLAQALQMPGD